MLELNVCVGSACHLKGSYDVIECFKKCIEANHLDDKVVIKGDFCLGHCTEAVSVLFDNNVYSVVPETAEKFFEEKIRRS